MKSLNRRDFLRQSVTTAFALSSAALLPMSAAGQDTESENPPNFIFILCDDLGWADLPVHGYEPVTAHGGWQVRGDLKMPNVDRMAAEGTICTQFYVSSAVCSPSRTGLMTGRFPSELGIHDYLSNSELNQERGMPDFVDLATPTVTDLLHENGYATGHFGKWHLGGGNNAPSPEAYGIDIYEDCLNGPEQRAGSSKMIADRTIEFIQANQGGPFYINVWLYDPHSPLHPTDEHLEPYMSEEYSPRWGGHLGALQVWYAVLTNLDKQMGRILDALDELGLSENTIVVFSSDNGPESGLLPFVSHYGGASSTNTGPFRGIKRSLYEGGIREPFIIRWPGTTPAGLVDNNSVFGGTDFLPTVLSLAGVPLPGDIECDGEDVSDVFRGKTVRKELPMMWENRFPVYGHVIHKSPMLAMRDGNWKLLMNPDRSRIELYDIPNDPTELNNVAERFPGIATIMSNALLSWQKTLPEGPVHPDAGSNAYPWPESTGD